MANESFANNLVVEVDGQALPADVKLLLTYAYVDDSRNLPDMFVLRFRDPGHVVLNKGGFKIGARTALKVQTADPGGPKPLMSGEITAVGVELDGQGTFTEVRGYDEAHRLFRGTRVAVYPNMTVADVVRKVAQRAKLKTGTIDDVKGFGGRPDTQLSQDNVSDWEFLSRLAKAVGAQIAVKDGKLDFRLPEPPTAAPKPNAKAKTNPLVLELHSTLVALRAGLTTAGQVPEVQVRGWDFENKQEIVATAVPTTAGVEVPQANPAELAKKFGAPPHLEAGLPYRTHAEAKTAADALAAQLGGSCAELTGVARGNPNLKAGTAVALTNVGEPFQGRYTLTSTRHLFAEHTGYTTEFTVSGRQERSLYGLTHGTKAKLLNGLVPAVVTNAKDPLNLGRVQLKFPWLSADFTSVWARTVQAGAGAGRGMLVLPEVGDEVLVGFEHGDLDAPYVLGGLHNGKDRPPELGKPPVDGGNGEIAVRGFVSRKGHKVELVEDEGIVISSGDGKFVVKLDQKAQTVEITSGGKVTVGARNGITVDAGTGPLELKGRNVAIKAAAELKAEGVQVKVAGQAQTEVTADGVLTVKGSIVKIN
ncbi:type IV secretion protein Rhs [Lentzea guizhouensis]|uniref:Type IV secretion protein Rhs n=1 Tax=Lentzea guizhouensis TaxID=1586287 RepID=A0A1B2HMD9_9PSEU|nr:VgrG-related protein [Lentzea guizhouensis]ANZ38866.1 type IV secretion protein Rhs [Lentzea guizhouensis]